MSTNFLDQTALTYDEIKSQIKSRLSEDSRFSNWSESQLYALISEIFTATTDLTNYYLERRTEESFPRTARLKSSVIAIADILGYSIRRPTPAQTSLYINMTSIPQGSIAGNVVLIPKWTQFNFNGNIFVLKDSLSYILTQQDINNFSDPSYYKIFEFFSSEPSKNGQLFDTELIDEKYRTPITLIQGEYKSYTIDTNNTDPDQRFQSYKIDDKDFSNFFGNEDFGFNVSDGTTDVTLNVTRIAVADDNDVNDSAFCQSMSEFDFKKEFIIDRRSLLNNDTIPLLNTIDAGKNVKYCVLKTNIDGTVEIKFGDDVVASIGATGSKKIYIKYLATKGAQSNALGVMGRKVECQLNSFQNNFSNQNLKFTLRRNVTNGNDLEDIESIKLNAPQIFYSLDRCVTPRDYINYLKTLTISGKAIRNARAWGEQEEMQSNLFKVPNIKLFNVVLFSILADLYKNVDGKYTDLEDLGNVLLTTDNSNDWFTLMVMSDTVSPLQDNYITLGNNTELKSIYDKIYSRSEITVKNIYVTPIVRDFKLAGYIYLNPLVDSANAYNKITDAIYSYLSKNADFNTPIYLSNIIEIIESFTEVNHADVYFQPLIDTSKEYLYNSTSGTNTESISATFLSVPVGYVFNSSVSAKEKCDTREYSLDGVDGPFEFYQKRIGPYLSSAAYSQNTINAIACLMPKLEMKIYKYDDDFARTEPIWPSNNSINNITCSITNSLSGDVTTNFTPSERNMYLGFMKCFYDNLMKVVSRNPSLSKTSTDYISGINKIFDEFLAGRENCFCTLKKVGQFKNDFKMTKNCKAYLEQADPNEFNIFINNHLLGLLELFRNTFTYEISKGLLDSYGNIVNYSIKNEIARIKAPTQNQYLYR